MKPSQFLLSFCVPKDLSIHFISNVLRDELGEVMSFRLPAEISKILEELADEEAKDKSELMRELLALGIKEKKLQKALRLYGEGKITLWKAARTAGVSLWQMTVIARERKVEAQYGIEELEEDLKALKESK